MKNRIFGPLLIAFSGTIVSISLLSFTQRQEPWRTDQLLNPADLAATIADTTTSQPVIISVGPGGVIPKSIEVGPAGELTNLKKFEVELSRLPKDTDIVIYCGCCPFNKCPNIRPAFTLLNDKGFKNHKLLNLTRNIKADWIDRGYPVADQ